MRRLRDQLNYLNVERDRYWFDTRPNLRREMESRCQRFSEKDDVVPLLRERLQSVFGKEHVFDGIHVFTPSADVPDEYGSGPRLVVLPPAAPCRPGADNPAQPAAEAMLTRRGEQPRQKQNRLLFLAADADALERLKDQARTCLAWACIVTDVEGMRLNLDTLQTKDFFGYASGKADDQYLGFAFGRAASPVVDEASLLIGLETAKACVPEGTATPPTEPGPNRQPRSEPERPALPEPQPPVPETPRRFYATVDLDPIRAKFDFAQIVDEVVEHFTTRPTATVTISVEIQAEDQAGFTEGRQRVVRKNCNVLKFTSAEFEAE